jgi:organic hydroperoxide reductase OsmC/OhrA
LYQVELQDAEAEARGSFSPAEKFGFPAPVGAFQEVTILLEVRSPAPPERLRELVAHAERACHTSQSLKAEVPVRLRARLNDVDLAP